MSAALSPSELHHSLSRTPSALPARLRRGLHALASWAGRGGYRPERHYMRGGTTQGSRSQAAARRGIAGDA
ncbi:hypothetical protein [Paracraurococcus ruber]|uniref:Uncharacterized protein n=1 Tax=Paracraurococcus ruber TaxID=77675 RepID=A0ABS1D6B6_9PROT|nr:hypothetical protein [Paracraurococcus ruber]MBK1662263.1 hypothetical protein [Paracraurococcus ruber]